jgi:hypothetical protein
VRRSVSGSGTFVDSLPHESFDFPTEPSDGAATAQIHWRWELAFPDQAIERRLAKRAEFPHLWHANKLILVDERSCRRGHGDYVLLGETVAGGVKPLARGWRHAFLRESRNSVNAKGQTP